MALQQSIESIIRESNGDATLLDKMLTNLELNINAYDMQGYALIHWAAYYGYTECIGILIKHGANILLNTMVFCCGSDFRCRIKSQLMILQ